MLMNAQVVHPTTAISTQNVITLMDHSTVLVEAGTVGMASAVVVCEFQLTVLIVSVNNYFIAFWET